MRANSMAQWTPESFVQQILEWDAEPPNAGYAHFEFVGEIAPTLTDIPSFADAVVSGLPATLAHSVLEHLHDAAPASFDVQSTSTLISRGHDIGSAASVAQFLISRLAVTPDAMLSRLFDLIRDTTDNRLVDQYSYACWTIVCGETLLLRENKTVGCLTNVDPSVLDDVLALPHLSDYARETLTECKR